MTTPTPATPLNVAPARRALQYTGSNSAELASMIDDFTVTSEDANQLTFTSNGQTLSVPRNGYVTWYRGRVAPEDVFANVDDFEDEYLNIAEADSHVHELKLVSGPAIAAGHTE